MAAAAKEVAPTTADVSSSLEEGRPETGHHLPRLRQEDKIALDHFKTVWMSPACHWTRTKLTPRASSHVEGVATENKGTMR